MRYLFGMTSQAGHRKSVDELAASALAEMQRISRRDLDAWRRVVEQRDKRILMAYGSGIGVNEITRRTGLAKTTVLRILEASK